ncbi:MAG: class I SAM-dependent DNA methyltransferase, partial [Verrucomicrobia bacterium]|nr:class I SAM-dependent DNA methyltransferase [Verrucomicrobiota bacterium]
MPQLSWSEVRERAIRFSRNWSGATSERADKQTFWNEFFEVFGIRRASVAAFEANVRNLQGHTNAIDLLWRGTLIVEHKSRGQSLERAETQAFGYIEDLTREGRGDEIPRYVLVSDFAHFALYDLEPEEQRDLPLFAGRPLSRVSFTLAEFPRHIRAFAFMLGQTRVRLDPEDPANQKAYDRMCELHDALKLGGFSGHELERLLVRILFCMFAEDTGIFAPEAFTQFVRTHTREDGEDLGARLNELFEWLNRPEADNAQEDTDPLYGFRYVNGGLFGERLGFARFNRNMRRALLSSCEFSWARISPAVFGSLFQGVLDDRARRQQGAHYTSERDIMKVLRSLFLDDLRAEWARLKRDRSSRHRANVEAFHERLQSLEFLDPACGCGNFLVLAYREIRGLEIEVMRELHGGEQQVLDVRQVLKVDVDQFHGIEYSEWPVRIAEVAMWLMDHQMNAEAAETFGQSFDRLPLRASPHIVHGNALRLDWNEVLPRGECSYVLGNPPFVGKQFR